MDRATATATHADVRYLYLAGGLFDTATPCASCQSGSCKTGGITCSDAGCNWWGCWQDVSEVPGQYAQALLSETTRDQQIPMITYYQLLQTAAEDLGEDEGTLDGPDEVPTVNDAGRLTRYFNDFRFLLQMLGTRKAILHVEPDFWGYAQLANADPHALPAAVTAGNPTDCGGYEDSVAGFSRCLIAMVRKYAPNTRVGLHASAWSGTLDATQNSDASADIAGEGTATGAYLLALGADLGDFVGVESSDRDAGYYKKQGDDTFWDATNTTLPNFHQAFTWVKALTEKVGRPALWWQMPVGNMALANNAHHYRDNRLDYFLTHTSEVVAAHGAGVFFGPGAGDQTDTNTDSGHFTALINAYASTRQALCP